jgi:CRP-like cAMP-binding protein
MDDWQRLPYFARLTPAGLARVAAVARRHQYQAGAVVFAEREPCAGFQVVLEGQIRIYRMNAEGRLHTLSLLQPVAAFNEVSAIDGAHNPYNAVAVTSATVWVITHTCLLKLLSDDATLMSNMLQALARINREYIERLEDMTFRTIPSRLAKLFLHETSYAEHVSTAPSQLTQEEIAAVLGTAREVVGRALRALISAGLLRKHGRQMYIADREGLIELAETNTIPQRPRNAP